jgi:hypothetical protein
MFWILDSLLGFELFQNDLVKFQFDQILQREALNLSKKLLLPDQFQFYFLPV